MTNGSLSWALVSIVNFCFYAPIVARGASGRLWAAITGLLLNGGPVSVQDVFFPEQIVQQFICVLGRNREELCSK